MPKFFFKEAPDVDYYVEWSTVVDGPIWTGTRAETLELMQRMSDPYLREDALHHPERRLERCDRTGTTSLWVASEGMRDMYPEAGSWEDDSYMYQQQGMLTRTNLFRLCHHLEADADADISYLLTPFEEASDEMP